MGGRTSVSLIAKPWRPCSCHIVRTADNSSSSKGKRNSWRERGGSRMTTVCTVSVESKERDRTDFTPGDGRCRGSAATLSRLGALKYWARASRFFCSASNCPLSLRDAAFSSSVAVSSHTRCASSSSACLIAQYCSARARSSGVASGPMPADSAKHKSSSVTVSSRGSSQSK